MTKLEPSKLMEQALEVMRRSIPEPRADGKANPLARTVIGTPDGTVEREYRGELRDGVTRKTAMSAPSIRTPSIVIGQGRPGPPPNRDTHRAVVSRFTDSSNGSDDGYILQDPEQSGCRIDGAGRHALLHRQGFRLPEARRASVSQVIAATVDAGLVKPDDRAGGLRKHPRYLPFWA